MNSKPTYEELEQKVKELEKKAVEHALIEESLKKAEKEKETVLNSMLEHVVYQDTNHRVIWANRASGESVGLTQEELVGRHCYEIWNRSSAYCTDCPVAKAFKTGQSGEGEIVTSDGRSWHVKAYPLRDKDENIVGAVEVALDITDQKAAADALKRNEEKLEAMLQSIGDHMSMMDKDLNIIWANKIAKKLFGNDIVGKKCFEAYHGRKEPCEPHPCLALKSFQDGQVHEHDTQVIDAAEEKLYFHCTSNVALRDQEGNPTAVIEISRDITEARRGEEERRRLESQLLQSRKMEAIGTLAGGIAHNFNNLLMGIQGYVSLMLLHIDSKHSHYGDLKSIEALIGGGGDLTRQLLGFARGGKYEVKPTDLNVLIENNLEFFGRTKKEIHFHKKYQKNIWSVEVDKRQLEQVLLNLYINAWQAMPRGGDLYVETSNVVLDKSYTKMFGVKPGNYVKISVTDTGEGMDETTRQRIFDPFFSTKDMSSGTGLRLASAYGIINNHGGTINVYSEKGRGSTFDIYLPTSKKNVVTEEKNLTDKLLKGTETVLIVDDEDIILDVGKEMLKEMGYKVLSAGGGKEAVEVYRKHKDEIDLLIIDMIMPDMGGSKVFERIKKINSQVKTLLSSGYSMNGEATEVLDQGCNGFIQKPFSILTLSLTIREILDKKKVELLL